MLSGYYSVINNYDNKELLQAINSKKPEDVEIALTKNILDENDLLALLSDAADKYLDRIADRSRAITLQRFGKTIRLYTPLYLSNECVNSCIYCGFNRKNIIDRVVLTTTQIEEELKIIASMGIKNIILVSGDNKIKFSDDMLIEIVKLVKLYVPFVSIEVRALDTDSYGDLKTAGADGFTMFQETYLELLYPTYHPAGPKSDFEYRLNAPERAAKAGIRNIGLGALLGLADYRLESFYLNLHTRYLIKKYPSSHLSASFPRLRSAAGGYSAPYIVTDKELYKSIFAYRLFNHDAGINISTRESQEFRDRLIHLGATIMSAGSKTAPGGYAKENSDAEQFSICDDRTVSEMIYKIRSVDYEAVLKDWF